MLQSNDHLRGKRGDARTRDNFLKKWEWLEEFDSVLPSRAAPNDSIFAVFSRALSFVRLKRYPEHNREVLEILMINISDDFVHSSLGRRLRRSSSSFAEGSKCTSSHYNIAKTTKKFSASKKQSHGKEGDLGICKYSECTLKWIAKVSQYEILFKKSASAIRSAHDLLRESIR